jgi:hypothetical protein
MKRKYTAFTKAFKQQTLDLASQPNTCIISIVFLLMFWLFWKDLSSYKGDSHQDFKSILVSTGVLGTFIGIFIGLPK